MENPQSSTLPVSGGRRRETAASKKRTVCTLTATPAYTLIRPDKSFQEVSLKSPLSHLPPHTQLLTRKEKK
jgi:hypothetical protein